MKTRRRFYVVSITCPQLHKRRDYKILSLRPDRAWHTALDEFFAEFPSAVERGLSVGGFVESFARWARLHRAAIAANAN